MHLSNKQRIMNKTFTVLSNKYCSSHNDIEQDQSNCISENINQLNNNRFCTFTKYKIKQQPATVISNQHQQRYFDSPTMIVLDDDDDDIPVSRCSNKPSVNTTTAEPSLNETELSDLLVFTNRKLKVALTQINIFIYSKSYFERINASCNKSSFIIK
jgi:hypothetical protein